MTKPISILVVDDSAFMRKMVTEILSKDPSLCVVGQARDGEDALRKLIALKPDVITLDVEMPIMDGLGALDLIMQRQPTPTVMLSSLTQAGAEITVRCLERGAVDFIGKPSGSISLDIEKIGTELIAKVKIAAGVRVCRLTRVTPPIAVRPKISAAVPSPPPPVGPSVEVRRSAFAPASSGVLVIGSSTGGPRALQAVVPNLPADLNVPIVIIQHMPPGFTASLANRLDAESPFPVREAKEGDTLTPGVALVAPGGHHLQFDAHGVARLTDEPPIHGVRPAVDVTLASLARLYGAQTVAVLLTGMGKDGARGLKTVHDMGGKTVAEDESTCVVYGMPKAAVELQAVDSLLPLPQIAAAVTQIFADRRKITR